MWRKDEWVRLSYLRDHAREALEMARGRTRADLDENRMLELALVRLLEVVGEAASRVSTDTRQAYPNVPWSQIVALRNRLIHGYDNVDLDVLWAILRDDLPVLLAQIEAILQQHD